MTDRALLVATDAAHADPQRSKRDAQCDFETIPAEPKKGLEVALGAVAKGVRSVHIIDWRNDHALLFEVLGNACEGTTVLPELGSHLLDVSLNYLRGSQSAAI